MQTWLVYICREPIRGRVRQEYIEPINTSPGLFFEHLGSLKISNAQLKVIIPMDISHFSSHIENIREALIKTRYLCNQTRITEIDAECRNMLQPLAVRYSDVVKEFESISHLIDNRSRRSAWIGGIGTILKQIFGTLDENDALRYDEAIESLQKDEKQIVSLLEENILVTKSVLSTFNNTIKQIENNEAILAGAIDKLSINIRNISETTNGLHILTSVNEIFDSLEAAILVLSFQLEDITNAILFSSQNVLHPSIMTPKQLYGEFVDHYRHLPSHLELPVNLDINSVHVLLGISKLICYYLNNKIVFVLQVPLVSITEYMFYHVIALPTPYDNNAPNKFSFITPQNKYIAMTKDKSHYCNLDSLDKCKTISFGSYICEIPNIYATDAKRSCESELLAKVISEKPEQCISKFVLGKMDLWKPLVNNRWIYIQSEPSKVSITCSDSVLLELDVLGAGILTIPQGCTGYCKSTTFIPKYSLYNITSPTRHLSDFNLIDDTCCNITKFDDFAGNVSPISLQNIDLDEFFSQNSMKIDSLLNKAHAIDTVPHFTKYGTHYSATTTIIVCIVLVVYFSIRLYRRSCKSDDNRNSFDVIKLNSFPKPTNTQQSDVTDRHTPIDIESTHFAPLRTDV